ncbi:MAG: aminopeptidase P N-terminal domain-containing protein [Flavobacterium sp.]
MKRIFLVLITLLFFQFTFAQSYFEDGLSSEFHKDRREALRSLMPENSIAIVFNEAEKVRSNDTYFTYRHNSDFYYLIGLREPNAAVIIFKEKQNFDDKEFNELLYVAPKDPKKEQWDGKLLGVDEASLRLGFATVFTNNNFLKTPLLDLNQFNYVLNHSIQIPEKNGHNEALSKMMNTLKEAPQPNKEKISSISLDRYMDRLRAIKSSEEIKLLREAIRISGMAHIEAMKSIKPGVSEYQIQAVHEYIHKMMGAETQAYGSIVGAGNNACILHYIENSKSNLQKGLVLMDVGAEFRGYAGDITRTVPVTGKFTKEEKAIYEIVLEALEAGINKAKNGKEFFEVQMASTKVINNGLERLGIITKNQRHPYFPHGIGHHLGLDVHDRGAYGVLEPGMVLTVEPGIYIPEGSDCDPKWWGIGIRIEDNILITSDGNENLSSFIPKTVQDIEKLMKQQGVLQKTNIK